MAPARIVLFLPLIGACARPLQATEDIPDRTRAPEQSTDVLRGAPIRWSEDTRSSNPVSMTDDDLRELAAQCGDLDGRLNAAAHWLVSAGSLGRYDDDIDRLRFALRASGVPYVTPQAWARSTRGIPVVPDPDESHALSRWLGAIPNPQFRRCGLARVGTAERTLLLVLVSAALAELVNPLPTHARVGQWLELLAEVRLEARTAKVVLLGPNLEPWTVPTELRGNLVRARFPATSPGRWDVQLVVDAGHGPQPVLEAVVFVDLPPPSTFQPESAPGEEIQMTPRVSPETAIATMLGVLRTRTGRPPLSRDAALDRLAVAHAESMRRARRLGHDIGAGGTGERLASSNVEVRWAGENVAHASDPLRVHRALWASPSHRSNLLDRRFSRWGLGVAKDADDSLWVCELFASNP